MVGYFMRVIPRPWGSDIDAVPWCGCGLGRWLIRSSSGVPAIDLRMGLGAGVVDGDEA